MAGLVASIRRPVRSVTLVGSGGLGVIRATAALQRVRDKTGAARDEAHRANLHAWMIADPARIDPLAVAIQDWNSRRARLDSRPIGTSELLLPALPKVDAPIVGIWGARDHSVQGEPQRAEAALRAVRPDTSFHVIADSRSLGRLRDAGCLRADAARNASRGRSCRPEIRRTADMSSAAIRLGPMLGAHGPGMLENLRVLEVADETAEYCGLILAGLGADVLKIEPPDGAPTRRIGPFLDDKPDPERSLHFWSYNRGKRSVTFDPKPDEQRKSVLALLDGADVLLDSSRGNFLKDLGIDADILAKRCPSLIHARMTPFGDTGPWKDFKGSDLVHLALGGVMMNCGYDPDPAGRYDLPPIAPQLWHAYHIAGEQLAVGIVSALLHRLRTGEGQDVSCAVHEAVSKNTELDVMSWVMRRAPLYRQTCRHAVETREPHAERRTYQGRTLVRHLARGRARRSQPGAVSESLWHGGRPRTARRGRRSQGAQHSRLVVRRRAPGPYSGREPAVRACAYLRQRSLERSPGGRPALGAGPQAA